MLPPVGQCLFTKDGDWAGVTVTTTPLPVVGRTTGSLA